MKRVLAVLCSIAAITVAAQNKIDFAGRILPDDPNLTYNVIVEFDNSDADFGDCKVDIVSRLGNMAVVNATLSQINAIAELPQVVRVSVGPEQKPLDKSSLQDSSITVQGLLTVDSLQPLRDVRPPESRHGHKSFIVVLWQKIKSIF